VTVAATSTDFKTETLLDGALAYERDRHRVGAHAVACRAAGGNGGAEESGAQGLGPLPQRSLDICREVIQDRHQVRTQLDQTRVLNAGGTLAKPELTERLSEPHVSISAGKFSAEVLLDAFFPPLDLPGDFVDGKVIEMTRCLRFALLLGSWPGHQSPN
jgi:hypothetical protein